MFMAPAPERRQDTMPTTPAKNRKARSGEELAAKVVALIAEEMAVEEAELTPNASFQDDLSLDEIDVAEILMQVEQSFKLKEFSDEEWESCTTVGQLVDLVLMHAGLPLPGNTKPGNHNHNGKAQKGK